MSPPVRDRTVRRLVLSMLVAVGITGCGGAPDAGFGPASIDVSVDVQADGSLIVDETTAGPLAPGTTTFDRTIDNPRADRFTWEAATIDGTPVRPGGADATAAGGVGVTVDDGRALHVRWSGLAGDGAPHVFGLRYRVEGATETIERRGRLVWPFGARGRGYPVARAHVQLSIPETSSLLDGTGIGEAGWTLAKTDRGIEASREAVGTAPATLMAEFAIDPTVVPQPDWQMIADLRAQFAPAFVSGGLFILVIGAGVLWTIRLQRTTRRRRLPADADATASALPAAVAARLARGRRALDDALLATAVERLHRGAGGDAAGTWTHRQVVDDWLRQRSTDDLSPDTLASVRPAFVTALAADLVSHGLVEGDRLVVASGLRTTALVGGAFAVGCAGLASLVLDRYGWWAQAIPLSMLIVAVIFLIAAPLVHLTSQAGDHAAGYWRRRFRDAASIDAAALAVAAGRGAEWVRHHPEQIGDAGRRLLGLTAPAQ